MINKKSFVLSTITVLISVVLVVTFVNAASNLTVPDVALSCGSPIASMKTLEDIYQRVVAGTAAGSHNLTPASSPAGTMHTLSEIFNAIPNVDYSQILDTYSLMGATGTIPTLTLSDATTTVSAGYYEASDLSTVDTDLSAGNIVSGTTIFGVEGSAETGGGGGVPKTGQTTSYADYDDGYYEKGLPTSGDHYTNNGDGTITDNVTGLEWVANPTAAGVGGTYSWADAITACEGLTYAGHSDWRLPNVKELQSIVDFSRVGPAIDTTYFTSQSDLYWSSTTVADGAGFAWRVHFSNGGVYLGGKTSAFYVRPVRGG